MSAGIQRYDRNGGPRNRTWRCGFGDRRVTETPVPRGQRPLYEWRRLRRAAALRPRARGLGGGRGPTAARRRALRQWRPAGANGPQLVRDAAARLLHDLEAAPAAHEGEPHQPDVLL